MKQAISALATAIFVFWAGIAAAQATFVQIEARPDLNGAQERARAYAANLGDVNGFRMATGWYSIALGPYSEQQAIQALQQLRAQGAIPPDSFLTSSTAYTQQFFPVGADALQADPAAAPAAEAPDQTAPDQTVTAEPLPEPAPTPAPAPETPPAAVATPDPAPEPAAPPVVAEPPQPVDTETPQEAARAEAQLSREEKFELQRALQWFDFYGGRIDAAFGPGTRSSMAAWQTAKGLEPTGILTTMQRRTLLGEYRSELNSIGLATRRDERAGIEMTLPQGMVAFDRYEPPFAHYTPINDSGVTVLMISQTGDAATLLGLYDIMQTLRIVPLEGERSRTSNSFTLTGSNSRITSYTYAVLSGGAVKGFTLIWPAGEDKRYEVALQAMRDSFRPIDGQVLPDVIGDTSLTQSVDLFSGLEIRTPERSRSGFYVDGQGTVLTSHAAVAGCGRVTLDEIYDARVVAQDPDLGVALLRPEERLAPLRYARFQGGVPRLQSEVAVSGYSYEGRLSSPTVAYGTLAELQGLAGEPYKKRLAVVTSPGDVGGPVFDTTGAVLGMLLPEERPGGRQLPEDVAFAADGLAIAEFLSNSGVSPAASDRSQPMSGEDLARHAADMTVLVSCWE